MRNSGINIRISDIIYGVIKRRFLIILLTVAGLLIGVVLSGISYMRGEMSREYLITSSFSVNTQTQSGLYTSGYDFPNYNDINMAEELVDAVSYALKSDRILNEIIDSLGLLGVTTTDIGNNLELTQYNETQIIEVSLYWRSSQEGINILTEINNRAPEILRETLNIGSVSVINEPTAQYVIGGRINMVLWGYMALLGLGLGLGITLLELIMRPTLINLQDVEDVYGLDILCEIGEDKAYFRQGKSMLVEDDAGGGTGEDFASAAHIIQTQLRKKDGPHIIYITSTLRGEGRTQLLANLGIRLSDLEKHVLLVDLDMKSPMLGGLFLKKVEYEHSLNALYAGDINEDEAVTTLTGYLDILPTVLERASIPLDSNLFSVIRKLADNYDYVLVDTAPVGITADSMSLNQLATAALFVIRYDTASLQEINDALERMRKSGVSILGCIVNGVKVSDRGIRNPMTENAKIRRAEEREEILRTPPASPEHRSVSAGKETSESEGIQSLMAGIVREESAARGGEGIQNVTTAGSFVKRLFEAEDNRAAGDSTESAETARTDAKLGWIESDREETVSFKEDFTETEEDEGLWEPEKPGEMEEPEALEDFVQEEEAQDQGASDTVQSSSVGYVEKTSDSISQAQKRMEELLRTLDNL